jgi:hypothetical protein
MSNRGGGLHPPRPYNSSAMHSKDKLSKEQILGALRRLSELLREKGVIGEFCIIDHATRAIAFEIRNSTRDGEAVSVCKQTLLDSARQVAAEFEMDEDWINPGTRGFISEPEEVTHDGITILYFGNHRQNPRMMMAGCQKSTLRESMLMVSSSDEFDDALADFLDRFNEAPNAEMLPEVPDFFGSQLGDNGRANAFLASTAAPLAQKHQLPVPNWASGNSRALGNPWFAAKSPNMKAILLQESPAAFRVRNLFVSANALSRA